ncbi:hypothetical protein Hanom_Chr08g00708701 [Helianthus anomalus]
MMVVENNGQSCHSRTDTLTNNMIPRLSSSRLQGHNAKKKLVTTVYANNTGPTVKHPQKRNKV